jgi:two-component system sensor histidine kinase BaeS
MNGTDVPTVAWMTGKDTVGYVQLVPPQADARYQDSMAWWYALLVVIGLGVVAGLAFLAALVATRGVRKPLRLVTAEAVGATSAAAVEVVPLSGPPEIKRLTAAVNRLAAQSSRAQRAEQSFLLSVSHELKTPLTSLRGYGEGLKDGALDAATAGDVIVTESSRLERFVQDLLDSARFGRGEFAVKKETVDLEALARDAMERHRAQAESLGVGLVVEGDAGARALGDPDRVVQVVSNLVENAVRCTSSGGAVTVAVSAGEVAVSDTGAGLGADDLEHAFERFYLHNRYGRGRDVGTGLGLAIVKDLVEKMEGSVAVASELGVGSTFTVRLPVAE